MPSLHASHWWTRRQDAGRLRLLLRHLPATGAATVQRDAALRGLNKMIDGFIPRASQRVIEIRRLHQPIVIPVDIGGYPPRP